MKNKHVGNIDLTPIDHTSNNMRFASWTISFQKLSYSDNAPHSAVEDAYFEEILLFLKHPLLYLSPPMNINAGNTISQWTNFSLYSTIMEMQCYDSLYLIIA